VEARLARNQIRHMDAAGENASLDTTSDDEFYDYYAKESLTPATQGRFRRVKEAVVRLAREHSAHRLYRIADIGCGAGTQSRLWAADGYVVHALDVNERLVRLAERRAADEHLSIRFEVGSATDLPWDSGSMDVCLLPELLEHVADWQRCLHEAARVLRPGGWLYLSTTNVLCPIQQEFNLPLYSWYPGAIKRRLERAAVTCWPSIANFAKYPAVHWFSYYGLRSFLHPLGFRCFDRFDIIDLSTKCARTRAAVKAIRASPLLRLLAHVATPGVSIIAVKS
jgi:2-polyprenyl-3-methyl-5-hydroxy-6-metoxy-1,4-benzoquinol methylase